MSWFPSRVGKKSKSRVLINAPLASIRKLKSVFPSLTTKTCSLRWLVCCLSSASWINPPLEVTAKRNNSFCSVVTCSGMESIRTGALFATGTVGCGASSTWDWVVVGLVCNCAFCSIISDWSYIIQIRTRKSKKKPIICKGSILFSSILGYFLDCA